ncbi:MAG TPA: Clp protease ClpP, partial [Planctomycetota bacterium]|nr:Clp protease ClpP [Planctomycetota bacterium]
MGTFSEYLEKQFNFPALTQERKRQLARIAQIRSRTKKREVLVMAANLRTANVPSGIDYSDLLPMSDQLSNLEPEARALDLILETPGGSGEVAEQIVRTLRDRFEDIAVIVPGWAKSAGTIMAMAADDILMGPMSALGPIDAQITWQGRVFSAHAFLEGLRKIKEEVDQTKTLNMAYYPILQAISPGDIEHAQNALDFAKVLVMDWLSTFKFKNWTLRETSGTSVTEADKRNRAESIATELCNQSRWKTHGRSIRLSDLHGLKLRITDYSKDADLNDAVQRYYTLLQMTFETGVYKVFETQKSQIIRFVQPAAPPPVVQGQPDDGMVAMFEVACPKCRSMSKVQANLGQPQPIERGCLPYPKDDRLVCPNCKSLIDLSVHRAQIEAQA